MFEKFVDMVQGCWTVADLDEVRKEAKTELNKLLADAADENEMEEILLDYLFFTEEVEQYQNDF